MARRFVFRFETMLRLRRQREDERKRVVAERLRQIARVEDRLASLHRQLRQEAEAIRAAQQPGRMDMQMAVRHRGWIGHLHRAVLEAQGQLRGLEARLAQERAALAEAARLRRVLEKLKERRREQFMQEQERIETRAADDLNTVRYVFEELQEPSPT